MNDRRASGEGLPVSTQPDLLPETIQKPFDHEIKKLFVQSPLKP